MFTTYENSPQFVDLNTQTINGMRFYKTPSGILLPSITTVLGAKEKPWLDNWRQMLGDKKALAETERCTQRGTAVHLMCEKYLQNVPKEEVTKNQPPEYVKLFNQIRLALNKVDQIRAQEVALWSESLGVAGRVDLVAEYNGKLSIIDFKTSNNNKTEDIIEDYFLQCTAYALMYYQVYGEIIEDIVVIITVEKGLMPLVFTKKIDNYVVILLNRIKDFKKMKKDTLEKANAKI